MIRAEFFKTKGRIVGFRIAGHSGSAEAGSDIVCAAVSSAAYMTANTVTDVLNVPARVSAADGGMSLRIAEKDAVSCSALLEGFRLHMDALCEQYPKNIQVIMTEV